MRVAILDPAAGISGDMTLGALIAVGLERSWLEDLPPRLGLPEVAVEIEAVKRCSVAVTKVNFIFPDNHLAKHAPGGETHGHSIAGLIERVRQAQVTDTVRDKAVRAFRLLGEAEGRVHGVPAEAVHLHEVGSADALLDIVGAIDGFERLGVDAVYNTPVALGDGWVDTEHGRLPVPAPATLALLEGIPVRSGGPVSGEATTPTGAVLVRVMSSGPPPVSWRVTRSGWGGGNRDPKEYPNALRLILGEQSPEAGTTEVITADIDDLTPEYVEPLREALLAAGAVDCQVWPTHGRKGRMSLRIEAVVPVGRSDTVADAMFAHSSSAGLRWWPVLRRTLVRRFLEVEPAPGCRVRVKVREGPTGSRMKAEYDDVVAAARRSGLAPIDLARQAERLAAGVLRNGQGV